MEKTIKYLEDKGILKRLSVSTKLSEGIVEALGGKVNEKVKREACRDVVMKEIAEDARLLNAILDDTIDEIIKHI